MEEFQINTQTKMGRVTLKVMDLHRQTSFYEQVVGLRVIERTAEYALLGVAEQEVLIELRKTAEKEQPAKGTGLYHIAFQLPTREAFATKFFEILRNKTPIDCPTEQASRYPHFDRIIPISRLDSASDHGYSESIYLHDLEANGIEIYVERQNPTEISGNHPLNFKELAVIANEESDGKLPKQTTIGHIHLRVSKFEETVDFYSQVLGFELRDLTDDTFSVASDRRHHHIAGNTWSGENIAQPLAIHSGLYQFEIVLPDEQSLDELKNHVKQFVQMQEAQTGFIVKDPSGNQIFISRN
ncbi:glyoxalase [Kurthia zopfii]|uniref:Catechol 2,3-dioxygenase n=1 Tax=Kurthia zopfii TaxID=1650 RepID=A0A2U3AE92_9BACL|nr:VOC family protein [Kurthia zopfii]PWI22856.1 glyoxalase [Kurthia zopfii]TDR40180.1 catechol 2,3-dioxygenase [Kurthia zopfii]STX09020.1 Catechol-2,3-dioxygenase [Kurthia zopfii]VEI04765.1 Catechol-2,3-dioxygenase [Kurthia zopfii]GEK30235.1 glyoxalase [Kurthia zopfii]